MNTFQHLKDAVDRGKQGLNITFSTGLPKLDEVIGGVGSKTYYLIGGLTGSGKTALADNCFILNPYTQSMKEDSKLKLRVFYYSFEISRINKIAKWICHLIFRKTQGKIIIDTREVFSRRSIISEEHYELIMQQREYIDKMEEFVHIFDTPINPTGIFMNMKKYADTNGKTIKATRKINGVDQTFETYIPNDPNEVVLIVEDHIALIRKEEGLLTKKERIDKGSEYAINMRNFYGYSKLAISQFNREIADNDRRRYSELTVQLEDFKDTGNVSEDAEVIMGLFNPARYNIPTYSGIDVRAFDGRYRNLITLKTRDGKDMIKQHINMLGEVGHFRELPDPFLGERHYIAGRNYTKWEN